MKSRYWRMGFGAVLRLNECAYFTGVGEVRVLFFPMLDACFPSWLLAGSRPGGRATFLAPPRKVSKRRRPLLSARCAGSRLAAVRAGSGRNARREGRAKGSLRG